MQKGVGDRNDIQTMLQRNTGYQLMKVPKQNKVDYIDLLMNPDTTGQYLCKLDSQGNQRLHVVGIDCNKKLIFDSMESYALELSKDNLDHCVRSELIGINKIALCRKLILMDKKESKEYTI